MRSNIALPISLLLFTLSCGQQPPPQEPESREPSVTQFTTHPANERDAAWSPDGKWISFGSMRSGNEDIWKKPAQGGEAVQLTTDPASDLYATWSPDGERLAFTSDRGGAPNVWTVAAAGVNSIGPRIWGRALQYRSSTENLSAVNLPTRAPSENSVNSMPGVRCSTTNDLLASTDPAPSSGKRPSGRISATATRVASPPAR